MVNRAQAVALLHNYIKSETLRNHSLATEVIMRRLAQRVGADESLWGLTGLLHDLDLELTRDDTSQHALVGAKILAKEGFPDEALQAIRAHNGEVLGLARQTDLDHALACAESITGLIVATALVQPDRKLASVKAKSVKKRMKEKRFAESVNRDSIRECEHMGIPLEEFILLSVEAMQAVAADLGL